MTNLKTITVRVPVRSFGVNDPKIIGEDRIVDLTVDYQGFAGGAISWDIPVISERGIRFSKEAKDKLASLIYFDDRLKGIADEISAKVKSALSEQP